MEKILEQIEWELKQALKDVKKAMNNKSAARRLRKFTSAMGTGIGKNYRNVSIGHHRRK